MNEKPLPEEFLNRYEPLELFSHNPISETLLVKSRTNGENYIAKLYDGSFIKEGDDEKAILSKLDHPGIPKLADSIKTEEIVCVIRDYAEGETLRNFYVTPAGERSALNIGIQLCGILMHLHTQEPPVIHRDIKPENIVIDAAGKITLIDFGIARRYKEAALKDTRYFVSDGFSAPEQYGKGQTLPQSDIYSLGKVLCWLLTGSTDIIEIQGIKNRALAAVIKKCAAFSYKDRYKSADSVKTALIRAYKKDKYIKNAALTSAALVIVLLSFIAGRVSAPAVNEYIEAPITQSQIQDMPVMALMPETAGAVTEEIIPATTATASVSETIEFKEPLIEAAVRLQLGLNDAEPIYQSQLGNVYEIFIKGTKPFKSYEEFNLSNLNLDVEVGNIKSLEDCAMLNNLYCLNIIHQPLLTDLSPLASNFRLSIINVGACNITDLSPLKSLPMLGTLCVNNNIISNLSCIKEMPALTQLEIWGMPILNFNELGEMPFLESLSVGSTPIRNLEGIEAYKSLTILSAQNCRSLKDLTPLLSLPELETLLISEDMREYAGEIQDEAKFEIVYDT